MEYQRFLTPSFKPFDPLKLARETEKSSLGRGLTASKGSIRISTQFRFIEELQPARANHKKKAIKYRKILDQIKPNIQLYNLINKINEIIQQLKNEVNETSQTYNRIIISS